MIAQVLIGLSVAYALMAFATYVLCLYLLHCNQIRAKAWMLVVTALVWPLVWFVSDETRKGWSDWAQRKWGSA